MVKGKYTVLEQKEDRMHIIWNASCKLSTVQNFSVTIKGFTLKPAKELKYLRVVMDEILS